MEVNDGDITYWVFDFKEDNTGTFIVYSDEQKQNVLTEQSFQWSDVDGYLTMDGGDMENASINIAGKYKIENNKLTISDTKMGIDFVLNRVQ